MTKTAAPLELKISRPIKIGETEAAQLSFVHQMMHWLRRENLPYGGSEDSVYIFAATKNHVVGCIELRPGDEATWIQAIYVDLVMRQRGIGQQLLEAAVFYHCADKPIGLGTRPENTAMKALARKMGFCHEIHEHWRK